MKKNNNLLFMLMITLLSGCSVISSNDSSLSIDSNIESISNEEHDYYICNRFMVNCYEFDDNYLPIYPDIFLPLNNEVGYTYLFIDNYEYLNSIFTKELANENYNISNYYDNDVFDEYILLALIKIQSNGSKYSYYNLDFDGIDMCIYSKANGEVATDVISYVIDILNVKKDELPDDFDSSEKYNISIK